MKVHELPSETVVRFQRRTRSETFGKVTGDSAATIEALFKFTARPYDEDGGLQNNLNRWYDLSTGRWMSVDPIGFEAGDVNLYRYVGNSPLGVGDPLGLLTGVQFAAPGMNGDAYVVAHWESAEECLTLTVDGTVRYSQERTQDDFLGDFDYKWLKRVKENTAVTGEIVIHTNKRRHVLGCSATLERWRARNAEVNFGVFEGLGVNFSFGRAEGRYTRYGGAVHNAASVWETWITVSAKWVHHEGAGDSNVVLRWPTSPFSRETEKVDDPDLVIIHHGAAGGHQGSRGGTEIFEEASLDHEAPLDKWFMAGVNWDAEYVEVDLFRNIQAGTTANAGYRDELRFKLPGVIRPD